jgi:predicted amidophosphoribosyltransferase
MGEVHYSIEDLKELQIYADCKEYEEMLQENKGYNMILCPVCWQSLWQSGSDYIYCPICGEKVNG